MSEEAKLPRLRVPHRPTSLRRSPRLRRP
jgi:hypothetical protein